MTIDRYIQARALAVRTSDAYSAFTYRSWLGVAEALLKYGLTERQAEAVMRSKWTRWAADASSARYGSVPTKAIIEFVKEQSMADIEDLTNETFSNAA